MGQRGGVLCLQGSRRSLLRVWQAQQRCNDKHEISAEVLQHEIPRTTLCTETMTCRRRLSDSHCDSAGVRRTDSAERSVHGDFLALDGANDSV
jgi:hypothetical protein